MRVGSAGRVATGFLSREYDLENTVPNNFDNGGNVLIILHNCEIMVHNLENTVHYFPRI